MVLLLLVIKMKFDLHMHSSYSKDGEFTPKELITIAKEKKLSIIALSDHNDMHGIDEMIEEGSKVGIKVIPAIEFDTIFEDKEVHLLGYGIDYTLPYFQSLGKLINTRLDNAIHERLVKLKEVYGFEVDEEEIWKKANGKNPWFIIIDEILNNPQYNDVEDLKEYRPGGAKEDAPAVHFFWDKCCAGTPCFVKVEFPDFKETVDIIHKAGGIAILAHPYKTFYHNEKLLYKAIEYGIDGLEAYSNYHDNKQNEYYESFAKANNLLFTCGSDFHGVNKPRIEMGEYGYTKNDSDSIINAFMNALEKKKTVTK